MSAECFTEQSIKEGFCLYEDGNSDILFGQFEVAEVYKHCVLNDSV